MILQKAIGCKLDYDILAALKAEASTSGHKANRIMNDAIVIYLAWVDACRRIQCGSAANIEMNIFFNEYKDVYKRYDRLQF